MRSYSPHRCDIGCSGGACSSSRAFCPARRPVGDQTCTTTIGTDAYRLSGRGQSAQMKTTPCSRKRHVQKRHSLWAKPSVRETSSKDCVGSRDELCIGGHYFEILEALGQGSFGAVWRAESAQCGVVAIKEIVCKSDTELQRACFEARTLQSLNVAMHNSDGLGLQCAAQLPALVLADMETHRPGEVRVRLAMSCVQGQSLEQFIADRKKRWASMGRHQQLEKACRYAGSLLVQLTPVLDLFSTQVYHRDITPRNIQIDCTGEDTDDPLFGLVDFGLAVDAERWRSEELSSDLGGDGQYWPASAWLMFAHGTAALNAKPELQHEYRTSLDVHALGISALKVLMDLTPSLQDLSGHVSTEYDTFDKASDAAKLAFPKLRLLHKAWARYWSDARRFWQPIFNLFKNGGDFQALKESYARAGVHRIVGSNLTELWHALIEAQSACQHTAKELRLPGLPALLESLILMIRPGPASGEIDRTQQAHLPSHAVDKMQSRGRATQRKAHDSSRCESSSTATPDSSPSYGSSVPSVCYTGSSVFAPSALTPMSSNGDAFVNATQAKTIS